MTDSREDKSIDELRAEAAETRQRVSQDVEALAYKVSPQNLKEEAKQSVRDAGHRAVENVKHSADEAVSMTRGFASDFNRAARENPIPTAMIGLGIGWLAYAAFNRRSPRRTAPVIRGRYGYEVGPTGLRSNAERYGSQLRGKAEHYQEQLSHMAEQGREKTSAMARDVSDMAERRARQAARRASSTYEENPLLVGALTMGAGLAIGVMLPHTAVEDRLIGEYREELFDRVKDGAQHAVEHGKTAIADAAAQAAKTATKEALGNTSSPQSQRGSVDRSASPTQNGI